MWNKLPLPDLSPTYFDADPRVPLILGRSFLKTRRALIDVFEGELTLLVGKEAITFNLNQTSRYSANYNDMTANRIDVIDIACEECLQEVLGLSDVIANKPLEVELKDLPPHLEYAFLEGADKFPVIIAKDLTLADLGARINLMPLSVWNKLSLLDLSPTCITLELADHSISCPVGVVEDVFVKVGTFHFSADFVVVDFDTDPRVPLILGRSFLKTGRALINVFEAELTLRVGKEAITFNLDQTSRYSANYNDMMANRIDVIDIACEEYSQEILSFSDVIVSGNPTPYYDPILSTTSPTLTPFGNSDFLPEEVDAFLALEDDPTSPEVD
nr:reverse transcriptase domain-containing protein [Tanacetum cinerariifolium]